MSKPIKVALAGPGAFGIKHLDAIKNIPGIEVVSLIGRDPAQARLVADKYGIGHLWTRVAEGLPEEVLPDFIAAILHPLLISEAE